MTKTMAAILTSSRFWIATVSSLVTFPMQQEMSWALCIGYSFTRAMTVTIIALLFVGECSCVVRCGCEAMLGNGRSRPRIFPRLE
jgi:hypothetical protein